MGNPNQRSLFSVKEIRSKFVSKVYTILLIQILAATALIAWFTFHQPTRLHVLQYGSYYLYGAMALGIFTYMLLICVESARRSFPINLVLLAILTLAYGLIAAVFSSRFDDRTVLSAFGATALATFTLILLARCSPFDMTTCGCGLCVLGLVHLLTSLILIIVLVPAHASTASLLIAGSGAFLFSLYMMYDLQLIMGGRSMELSPEEYILAAALLYIDIVQLFQYMLVLFGSRD